MKYYKTVLLPIEVAEGDFCFGAGRCCSHFTNYEGPPECDLRIGNLKYDEKEYHCSKPIECKNLKEIQ